MVFFNLPMSTPKSVCFENLELLACLLFSTQSRPAWPAIPACQRSSASSLASDEAGMDQAMNAPFSGPFGPSQIPKSVTSIEAAMREMLADMAEDESVVNS